jgi:hypothetical protein
MASTNKRENPMPTSTFTLAASPPAHYRPTVSSMTKRKLQLVVGVILLVVWIVSVALVGFVVRHGGSLRSSMSAASLLTAALTQRASESGWSSLDLPFHPNASAQRR